MPTLLYATFLLTVLQGSMAGEVGVADREQQDNTPLMLPHEQAAAEAVHAAVVAQEAAHKALLKAQQAQQAQQNYIAAEVARQVQARAAKISAGGRVSSGSRGCKQGSAGTSCSAGPAGHAGRGSLPNRKPQKGC